MFTQARRQEEDCIGREPRRWQCNIQNFFLQVDSFATERHPSITFFVNMLIFGLSSIFTEKSSCFSTHIYFLQNSFSFLPFSHIPPSFLLLLLPARCRRIFAATPLARDNPDPSAAFYASVAAAAAPRVCRVPSKLFTNTCFFREGK